MPIYEYRCGNCGHEQEFMQRMSDAPMKKCPKCGKSALKKLLSAAGFQLKGTGWYATDFKDKKSASKTTGKAGKADKPGEAAKPAEAPAKESSKTDSSPKSTAEKA